MIVRWIFILLLTTITASLTLKQANEIVWLYFSQDAAEYRENVGMPTDPPAVSFGIFPAFDDTTNSWSMTAVENIPAGSAIVYVNNATLLRSEDCPELNMLQSLSLHCTVALSFCLMRRCRLGTDDSSRSSTASTSHQDVMWSLYCQLLPNNNISPVLALNPTDPTLSPYTRQTLIERRKSLLYVETVAKTTVFSIWKSQHHTIHKEWNTQLSLDLQWAQSMVISRAWSSSRFGCAAIPVLDFVNHKRGMDQIRRVKSEKLTQQNEVAWGFSTLNDMKKGDEYYVSYDEVDGCDVDLWLDYGFIEKDQPLRPCVQVSLSNGTIVKLKRGMEINIEKKVVQEFRTSVKEQKEEGDLALEKLMEELTMRDGGLRVVADDPKRILLESELDLLKEILFFFDQSGI